MFHPTDLARGFNRRFAGSWMDSVPDYARGKPRFILTFRGEVIDNCGWSLKADITNSCAFQNLMKRIRKANEHLSPTEIYKMTKEHYERMSDGEKEKYRNIDTAKLLQSVRFQTFFKEYKAKNPYLSEDEMMRRAQFAYIRLSEFGKNRYQPPPEVEEKKQNENQRPNVEVVKDGQRRVISPDGQTFIVPRPDDTSDENSDVIMPQVSEEIMPQVSEEIMPQVSEEIMPQVSEEIMPNVSEVVTDFRNAESSDEFMYDFSDRSDEFQDIPTDTISEQKYLRRSLGFKNYFTLFLAFHPYMGKYVAVETAKRKFASLPPEAKLKYHGYGENPEIKCLPRSHKDVDRFLRYLKQSRENIKTKMEMQ